MGDPLQLRSLPGLGLQAWRRRAGSLVFGLWGKLQRIGAQPLPQKPSQLLVVNFLRIGDTVVTFPLIDFLKSQSVEVTLVVRQSLLEFCQSLYPDLKILGVNDDLNPGSLQQCAQQLKDQVKDALILDTQSKAGWLANKSGARSILGYDSHGRGCWLSHAATPPGRWNTPLVSAQDLPPAPYQGDAWMALLKRYGFEVPAAIPKAKPAESWIESLQQKLTLPQGYRVLLHPGSSPSYQWPTENWQSLIRQWRQSRPDVLFVLSGGPGDQKLTAPLCLDDQVIDTAGQLSLGESCALVSQVDEVVSVDTSMAHMAALVGTKVTVLFGPGESQIWGPRSDHSTVRVIQGDMSCQGCKRADCPWGDQRCMTSIEVDQVLA